MDLGNGLAPNRWQAITWTKVDQNILCHMGQVTELRLFHDLTHMT